MNQQAQYKEVVRILNKELQEVKEKLTEVSSQNDKLQEEVTGLGEKLQTAGANAIRDFKVSQSFFDSCGEYYGTGFEDCLQQVASAYPELDLSGITMDDEDDSLRQPTPRRDDNVILA